MSMNSPYINDLLWLMEGHFIESDIDLSLYWKEGWEEDFQTLSDAPESLEQVVRSCKSHFLGCYFEVLFSFAIRHFSTLTVLLEHVQISEQGKTLGEVDMLVETPEGELLQFEIAIKFYLERPDLYPDHWIGPNKNDSLRQKVSRARSHQLTIFDTDCAKVQCQNVIKDRPIKTCLLIYGRLYLSLNNSSNVAERIENTQFGGWVYASKAEALFFDFPCVMLAEKPHWLSLQNFTRSCALSTTKLIEDFNIDSRPKYLCLWQGSKEVISTPKYSIFVVPDTW